MPRGQHKIVIHLPEPDYNKLYITIQNLQVSISSVGRILIQEWLSKFTDKGEPQ